MMAEGDAAAAPERLALKEDQKVIIDEIKLLRQELARLCSD